MKIDRLFGITIFLINHSRVSAKVLSERFEVSLRTIQRDIDTLCQAGIPIVSAYGSGGGYEILDSFKMERQVAGQIDYSFIITALRGLASAYPNPMAEATLEKIISLSPKQGSDLQVFLDFSVLKEGRDTDPKLKMLEKAIESKCLVFFEYTNSENLISEPNVEPIALTYKWYAWYLLGYSLVKEDYRLYKLLRMRNIQLTDRKISHEHDSADMIFERNENNDSRNYLDIRLFCKAEAKMQTIEYLNGVIEAEQENGDFVMKLHLPENEQFWFGTLLSLGNLVQIIEPESLKDRLCTKCKEILKLYPNL
ncbi:WYL domain-containing protein [Desulfosporosinus sp. PR]|uniref:helix-turn-helix transcriptional regulator n=1 Tax=Candidatus Desulfosporosinus nitrosoreducens TaxID=3401928 RepID=UPI0027E7CB78|nr:WYL domain-containing protein [Desulfosporosinus sp. PR]MDQ7094032.1 WYL domain-containing protein [Desulfosporosinus sp. PR]